MVIPCVSILVLLHLCFFHGTLREWPNDNEQDGLGAVSHGVGMHPGGVDAPVAFVGNGNEQDGSGEKEKEMQSGDLHVQAGKENIVEINEDVLVEIEVGSE